MKNQHDASYLMSYFMAHIRDPNNQHTRTVQSGQQKLRTHNEIRHWYVPHCANTHWYYLKLDIREH